MDECHGCQLIKDFPSGWWISSWPYTLSLNEQKSFWNSLLFSTHSDRNTLWSEHILIRTHSESELLNSNTFWISTSEFEHILNWNTFMIRIISASSSEYKFCLYSWGHETLHNMLKQDLPPAYCAGDKNLHAYIYMYIDMSLYLYLYIYTCVHITFTQSLVMVLLCKCEKAERSCSLSDGVAAVHQLQHPAQQ